MEQFSSALEALFSFCVSKAIDADATEGLGADELAAVVFLDCVALEVLDV
jgi:hypothetical protein